MKIEEFLLSSPIKINTLTEKDIKQLLNNCKNVKILKYIQHKLLIYNNLAAKFVKKEDINLKLINIFTPILINNFEQLNFTTNVHSIKKSLLFDFNISHNLLATNNTNLLFELFVILFHPLKFWPPMLNYNKYNEFYLKNKQDFINIVNGNCGYFITTEILNTFFIKREIPKNEELFDILLLNSYYVTNNFYIPYCFIINWLNKFKNLLKKITAKNKTAIYCTNVKELIHTDLQIWLNVRFIYNIKCTDLIFIKKVNDELIIDNVSIQFPNWLPKFLLKSLYLLHILSKSWKLTSTYKEINLNVELLKILNISLPYSFSHTNNYIINPQMIYLYNWYKSSRTESAQQIVKTLNMFGFTFAKIQLYIYILLYNLTINDDIDAFKQFFPYLRSYTFSISFSKQQSILIAGRYILSLPILFLSILFRSKKIFEYLVTKIDTNFHFMYNCNIYTPIDFAIITCNSWAYKKLGGTNELTQKLPDNLEQLIKKQNLQLIHQIENEFSCNISQININELVNILLQNLYICSTTLTKKIFDTIIFIENPFVTIDSAHINDIRKKIDKCCVNEQKVSLSYKITKIFSIEYSKNNVKNVVPVTSSFETFLSWNVNKFEYKNLIFLHFHLRHLSEKIKLMKEIFSGNIHFIETNGFNLN
jgi:hypothetical protein